METSSLLAVRLSGYRVRDDSGRSRSSAGKHLPLRLRAVRYGTCKRGTGRYVRHDAPGRAGRLRGRGVLPSKCDSGRIYVRTFHPAPAG